MHSPSFMGPRLRLAWEEESNIYSFKLHLCICLFVYCVCTCTCAMAHVWKSENNSCESSFPPTTGSWGFNVGPQAAWQVPRLADPFPGWAIFYAIFYQVFLKTKAVPCSCSSGEGDVNFPSSLCSTSASAIRGTKQALSTRYWRSSSNHG